MSSSTPASGKDELRKKLAEIITECTVVRVDNGQAYFHDTDEATDEIMQLIAQHTQQAVQTALERIQAQGHGGGNWRRLIELELAAAQPTVSDKPPTADSRAGGVDGDAK